MEENIYTVASPEDIILCDDDFDYMRNVVMHARYLNTHDTKVSDTHIYETAKTIISAMQILNQEASVELRDAALIIDKDVNTSTLLAQINMKGDYHRPSYFMIWVQISYDGDQKMYTTKISSNKGSAHTVQYPVDSTGILSYDMNFPFPSEYRSIVVDMYKRTFNAWMR